MPVHDHVASVVAMARALRGGVDQTKETTQIRSATLVLLLDTLIEVGQPSEHPKMTEVPGRTVEGVMASFARGAVNGA